jgi:diacylglycerol O-acyltransferase
MPGPRLAAADAAWLALDRPRNRMVVTAVLRLDGPVDPDALCRLVVERLLPQYPRLSQRVVPRRLPWLRPRWQDDPDFAVRRHVRSVRLDGSVGRAALQDLVGDLLGRPLDLDAPPWELHVVEGADEAAGRRGAVVARFHHCLADGKALAEVLLHLTDDTEPGDGTVDRPANANANADADADADADPPSAAEPGDAANRPGDGAPSRWAMARKAPALAFGVVRTVAEVVSYLGEPRTALRGRLGTAKAAAWTEPHDLQDVKQVAEALGASVNDVLLAALAGGLRRHAERRGDFPRDVRVVVPVDLRAGEPVGRELGNQFGLVLVRLPVGESHRLARLRAVVAATDAAKRSPQAVSTHLLVRLVGALQRPVSDAAAALIGGAASAVVTNVPGPRQPLSLLDRRLRSVVFWVPQVGRIGVGVSIFSYAGTVTIGVATDARLTVDPEALAADVDAEITQLADHVAG